MKIFMRDDRLDTDQIVVGGGLLLARVTWVTPGPGELQVALIQGAVPQDRKWLPSQREPTKDLYRGLTAESASAELVIWPEAAIPAVAHEELDYLAAVEADVRVRGADLPVGQREAGQQDRRPLRHQGPVERPAEERVQQPQDRRVEEGENEEHDGVDRVAREHDTERGREHDARENV